MRGCEFIFLIMDQCTRATRVITTEEMDSLDFGCLTDGNHSVETALETNTKCNTIIVSP